MASHILRLLRSAAKTAKTTNAPKHQPGVRINRGKKRLFVAATQDAVCNVRRGDTVELVQLLKWPDEFRGSAFAAIVQAGAKVQPAGDGEAEPGKLFTAILSQMKQGDDPPRRGKLLSIALEAATLESQDSAGDSVILDRIRGHYHDLGDTPPPAAELRSMIGRLRPKPDAATESEQVARSYLATLAEPDAAQDVPALVHHRGQWYRWSADDHWRRVDNAMLKTALGQHAQSRGVKSGIRNMLEDALQHLRCLCSIDATEELPPPLIYKDGRWQRSKRLAVANGLLQINKSGKPGKLYEFTPRQFATSRLGFEYDRMAKCPTWWRVMYEIFPPTGDDRDKRIKVLQEFIGLQLLVAAGQMPPNRGQCLLMVGEGGTGKSTIQHVMRALLGAGNCGTSPVQRLVTQFGLTPMLGKVANISGEISYFESKDEALLKSLVGREPVDVERKGRDTLPDVTINASYVFAGNDLPPFSDRTDGLWRRLIIMPFLVQFDDGSRAQQEARLKADPELAAKLDQELPGIANWALEGAARYVANGYTFTRCAVCQAARDKHRLASDHMRQFKEEELRRLAEGDKKLMGSLAGAEAYRVYRLWAEECGYRPMGKHRFLEQLGKLTGTKISEARRRERGWCFPGWRIRNLGKWRDRRYSNNPNRFY
jgi:putative DNA primase/helicase